MLNELSEFLRPLPAHLRRLWRPDIGTQVLCVNGECYRIPKAGNTTRPFFHDHTYHPALTTESVLAVGVNGWNWADQVSEFVTFDIDAVANHTTTGLPPERLVEIVAKLMDVPDCELIRSKSGHGIHARMYFGPFPRALTHTEHAHNGARVLAWLARTTGLPLESEVDACGAIAWIYHRDTAPNGFELLKGAT